MAELPAIALEDPRGVGKTATAERRAGSAYYLDDPAQMAVAEADPRQVLTGKPPVLIDEWQRIPEVWDAVRRAVDRGAGPGSFLLTGSAKHHLADPALAVRVLGLDSDALLSGKESADLLDAIVVNAGPNAYRRPDGIGVVPAALLGP